MPAVLITGASRGLGLEFVRQYSTEGWDVLACARTPLAAPALQSLAQQAHGRLSVHALDVADFSAIESLAHELAGRSIDLLLNVAGSMGARGAGTFEASNFADWESVFKVNTYAPMKMAQAFATHVAASAEKKIVSISTLMASMSRNTLGGFYAYRASKAALNAIMVSMAIDLGRKHDIVVGLLHPGWVSTDMGGPRAPIDAQTSVTGMRRVIATLTKERAGRFWAYDGSEVPW